MFYFFVIKGILPVYISVYCLWAWLLQNADEGIGSPKIRITDSHELPCVLWEPNYGPLENSQ